MKQTILFLCVVLSLFVGACSDKNKDDLNAKNPSIVFHGENSLVFPAEGGKHAISFNASDRWIASVANDRAGSWLSINPMEGSAGNNQLYVTVKENESLDERNATILLKSGSVSKTIVITQKQKDALTVSAAKYEVSSKGETIQVEVKSNVAFNIEVKNDWIKQVESRSVTTTSLVFSISSNDTGDKREGEISLKSGELEEVIKVYQDYSDFITLTERNFVLPSAGGNIDIEVRSTLEHTVKMLPEVDWVVEDKSRSVSTHTYHYRVKENDSYDAREAKIVFFNNSKQIADTVTVYQAYKGAILVSRDAYEFKPSGGNLELLVQSNLKFEVTSSVDWIQYDKSRALVESVLHFTILPFEEEKDREGTIIIKAVDAEESQEIKVKQYGFASLERNALIAFYKATNGDKWKNNTNWCSERPLKEWYGVRVNNMGRVYILDLNYNNLEGTIPEEIVQLTQLEYLLVGGNKISNISNRIDELHQLTSLVLYQNLLKTIPVQLGNLKLLQTLLLSDNQICGTIPVEIGNLGNLVSFIASNNQLVGEIPGSFKNLTKLSYLKLDNNQLTGAIPNGIDNLSRLTELNLSNNHLIGVIPNGIGNLSRLTELNLSNNQLTGAIPNEIGSLSQLIVLDLTKNKLAGNIPNEIGRLTQLAKLAFSNNQLTGSIPSGIGNLSLLSKLYLSGNQLTGIIPSEISKLSNLEVLHLEENALTGNIPISMATMKKLYELSLKDNCLNGLVQDEIVNMFQWQEVWDLANILPQKEGYKLTYHNYTSSDYSQDGKVSVLQKHTKGKGIKIVIIGDGYSDRMIAKGLYSEVTSKAMEDFFMEEPYHSFREYFDVYSITAVSPNEYIDREENKPSALGTNFDGQRVSWLDLPVKEYVLKVPDLHNNLADVTTILIMNNRRKHFRSYCTWWNDDFSVARCFGAGDNAEILHHEANGHGFGKLDDEYIEFDGWVSDARKKRIMDGRKNHRFENVDLTNDANQVIWRYFITDTRYRSEKIGIYEGASLYPYGVYRATENSIMKYNTGGFNAPSRWAIYKRIMELAGEEYDFERFLAYDEINRIRMMNEASKSRSEQIESDGTNIWNAPPIVFDYPSTEIKK